MSRIEKIASRDNQRLKLARKIRDGMAGGKMFIEGTRLVEEALRSKVIIDDCFVSSEFRNEGRGQNLLDGLIAREYRIFEVPESIFSTVADTNSSQGIILIGDRPQNGLSSIEKTLQNTSSEALGLVLFLYEINDPSNLGAVLRTAEAADVAGVIVSKGSADAFSPKALRAAMGAGFRVPIWEAGEVDTVLAWGKKHGFSPTGADVNAKNAYTKIDWKVPRLLVFGSEAHGLSRELREKMDELVHIPMMNSVESLNLSVSCGVLLFEALRQKSGP